jgi:predicted nucleotidyltransferase
MYNKTHIMYVLNIPEISKALHNRGYRGLRPLLKRLGLHRNTLDRFIRGAPVLPSSVEKVLAALDLQLERALCNKESLQKLPIDELVTNIHAAYPQVSIFLFGSRARNSARRYSDYDLGVYSSGGISLSQFLAILEHKERYEEVAPEKIDCVNLNQADKAFLSSITPDIRLLAGYERDMIELRERTYE